MPKVYLIHPAKRWDGGAFVGIDFSKAEAYGELVTLLPEPPPADCVEALRRFAGHVEPGDFLVIAGNMDLFAWATALAMRATGGKVRLLKWHARKGAYKAVEPPEGLWD